jgi:hypothetical protein
VFLAIVVAPLHLMGSEAMESQRTVEVFKSLPEDLKVQAILFLLGKNSEAGSSLTFLDGDASLLKGKDLDKLYAKMVKGEKVLEGLEPRRHKPIAGMQPGSFPPYYYSAARQIDEDLWVLYYSNRRQNNQESDPFKNDNESYWIRDRGQWSLQTAGGRLINSEWLGERRRERERKRATEFR